MPALVKMWLTWIEHGLAGRCGVQGACDLRTAGVLGQEPDRSGLSAVTTDFPTMMRQAGRAGADIVIGPSNDWRAIAPSHDDASTFRAVENGYSLLRPASNGLSLAVDYRGQVRAAADYFTAPDRQVLTATLPTHGVRSIYSRIGDVFAWACLAGLALLAVAARPRAASQRQRRPSAES